MRQLREPYFANTLINVQLPAHTVSTPGELRARVVLFPMPSVEASGRLSSPNVSFDTGTWFAHDLVASTLPARCPSQAAAQRLADTWNSNVATSTVDPGNNNQVVGWCRWFVDQNPDCATFVPMAPPPAGDALTTAVVKALTAVTGPPEPAGRPPAGQQVATLSAAADNDSQARPAEGQTDDENQEAAS